MSEVLPVIDVERLLAPIPGNASLPAGRDIRHDPVYAEINSARRSAEAAGSPAAQAAAWAAIADLAEAALATKSKHLQVAVWLTEALSRLEGFRGAATGFRILSGLLERYWDSLHPALEPGDSEPLAYRVGPLHWIAERLADVLRAVPLSDRVPYGLVHYEATLKSGKERQALLDDGWPSGEQFRHALRSSQPAFLEQARDEVVACQAALAQLEQQTDRLFVETRTSPAGEPRQETLLSFSVLREVLESARALLSGALVAEPTSGGGLPVAQGIPGSQPGGGYGIDQLAQKAGDEGLAAARAMVSSNQIEGLRLLQSRVSQAESGRDRFLRRLQFAEICLEAGMFSLALPMYVDLTRVIEERTLVTWEHHDVIARAWQGLKSCCERDGRVSGELSAVYQKALSALSLLESASSEPA